MKRILTLLLVFLLLFTACSDRGGSSAPAAETDFGSASQQVSLMDFPRLDGSTANLPLMRALLRYYTGVSADEAETYIQASTTDYAYSAIIYDQTDLLLVYEASEQTKQMMKDTGIALEIKPIGLDALVFLCNAANPVESLTTDQIQKIYAGEIHNWNEVGGNDAELIPYQRTERSGSQTMMEKLVMKDLPMTDAPTELRPGAMSGLVDQIVEYENSGNALGYSVYYYIKNMYAIPDIKMLAVDSVAPSNQSISDGSYPFVNEFFAIIRADVPADSLTRQIFDFLTTDEGRALIEKAGYVPK